MDLDYDSTCSFGQIARVRMRLSTLPINRRAIEASIQPDLTKLRQHRRNQVTHFFMNFRARGLCAYLMEEATY